MWSLAENACLPKLLEMFLSETNVFALAVCYVVAVLIREMTIVGDIVEI